MEEEADQYFERIDALGGVIPAIEQGFFQREIAEAAYRYQQALDSREKIIVGVNAYEEPDEPVTIPLATISPDVERGQRRRLAEVRGSRSAADVERTLADLRRAAAGWHEPDAPAARVYARVCDARGDVRRPDRDLRSL